MELYQLSILKLKIKKYLENSQGGSTIFGKKTRGEPLKVIMSFLKETFEVDGWEK